MYMGVINASCDHVSSVAISPSRAAQSVARLTQEPEVQGSILGPPHTFVSPFADSRRAIVSHWQKYGHLVMVNRLGGLSLSTNSMFRLTHHPDMTTAVYRGRLATKTTVPIASVVLTKLDREGKVRSDYVNL